MSTLELRTLRRFNGLGSNETPEVRSLPWDKPSEQALRKEARMGKVQEWALVVGLVGGALGLYLSVKALRRGK